MLRVSRLLTLGATVTFCIFYVQQQLLDQAISPSWQIESPAALRPWSQARLQVNEVEPRILQEAWKACNKSDVDDTGKPKDFSNGLNNFECNLSKKIISSVGNRISCGFAIFFLVFWHLVHAALCFLSRLDGQIGIDGRKTEMNSFIRDLCLAVIVLNIFYGERVRNETKDTWPFQNSCLLLTLEAACYRIVQTIFYKHPEYCCYCCYVEEGRTEVDQNVIDLKIRNSYQKLSMRFTQICIIFVIQLALGLFYVHSLANKEGGWKETSGWRWFLSVLLVIHAGDDEHGKAFHMRFWLTVLLSGDHRVNWQVRLEMGFRMMMSMVINMFIRRIIFCTAPIFLGTMDTPMDFILNAMAIFYITKLDDLEEETGFGQDLKQFWAEIDALAEMKDTMGKLAYPLVFVLERFFIFPGGKLVAPEDEKEQLLNK